MLNCIKGNLQEFGKAFFFLSYTYIHWQLYRPVTSCWFRSKLKKRKRKIWIQINILKFLVYEQGNTVRSHLKYVTKQHEKERRNIFLSFKTMSICIQNQYYIVTSRESQSSWNIRMHPPGSEAHVFTFLCSLFIHWSL